ncbi:MAG: hypothetical protein WCB15_35285 [Desulfobacterales bacterium]|jgi:hypothetical protein
MAEGRSWEAWKGEPEKSSKLKAEGSKGASCRWRIEAKKLKAQSVRIAD